MPERALDYHPRRHRVRGTLGLPTNHAEVTSGGVGPVRLAGTRRVAKSTRGAPCGAGPRRWCRGCWASGLRGAGATNSRARRRPCRADQPPPHAAAARRAQRAVERSRVVMRRAAGFGCRPVAIRPPRDGASMPEARLGRPRRYLSVARATRAPRRPGHAASKRSIARARAPATKYRPAWLDGQVHTGGQTAQVGPGLKSRRLEPTHLRWAGSTAPQANAGRGALRARGRPRRKPKLIGGALVKRTPRRQ